jgi:hypothetical protein
MPYKYTCRLETASRIAVNRHRPAVVQSCDVLNANAILQDLLLYGADAIARLY